MKFISSPNRQSIECKYIAPSNRYAARIKARTSSGHDCYEYWDGNIKDDSRDELEYNARRVAAKLCSQLDDGHGNWVNCEWIGAGTKTSFIFVAVK
jgi:hypothetical protein